MLIVISPAKSLDFDCPVLPGRASVPEFLEDAKVIIGKMQTYSPKRIGKLMDISKELSELNFNRYANWQADAMAANSRPAILAFKGDVYLGMEAMNFTEEDLDHSQNHLRILSGLYGVLRPLDMMQPYRLEMGTALKIGRKPNLYKYWGPRVAESLNNALAAQGDSILVNLASEEYFGAVDLKVLKAKVIKPVFMDEKQGKYKVVSFWAKRARGMMAAFILQNRLVDVEMIKSFSGAGYAYNGGLSDETNWVFTRDEVKA
jgi:cytoplasmic iron level regulating protein YaaA (DUF328/UPF0246 family)